MQKTLKVLCDRDSSSKGSIRCYSGPDCLGGENEHCDPFGYWSGGAQSSNVYYYLRFIDGEVGFRSITARETFSARCVRYLMKLCLLCIKSFKITL